MAKDHVSIRLTLAQRLEVDKLAELEERTRSDMLRKLINEALATRKAQR